MKKQRIVQTVKNDLKGSGRKMPEQLMASIRRALSRRGIKGVK